MNVYSLSPATVGITDWSRNIDTILHDGVFHAVSEHYDRSNRFYPSIQSLDYLICYADRGSRKITDTINCSVLNYKRSFLINDRLKDILSQYTLPEHQFSLVRVLFRKEFYDYHLFHFSIDATDKLLIREKSDLRGEEKTNGENIYSKNGDLLVSSILSSLKNLTFNTDIQKFDLFAIPEMFSGQAFISEKLKNALIQNKITGFDIRAANWVTFE
jgi:hypothetical protein